MYTGELAAIVCYFIILLTIGFFSYRKHLSASAFIIGDRSLNYWLTALAAHASDMSSWLFMGYPALVFTTGMTGAWAGIGLIVFMYLNWQFIAPKIRVATEQYNSLTFSSFFESRLADTTGVLRIFTACILIFFYTTYISSGLVGLGLLLQTLFNLKFSIGILIGIFIIVPYVFTGGYVTLAWIDLFQGLFLMCVILFVPLYVLPKIGGWNAALSTMHAKNLSTSLFPNFSGMTLLGVAFTMMSWGLGYFGQPHIITKFMGIKNVKDMPKSKYVGMTWMVLSLGAATLVGIVAVSYFKSGLHNSEEVFIRMVRDLFPPAIIGFILCAVLAATINAMSSQILVLSSSLTEDFYKRLINKNASSKELLLVSRLGVVIVAAVAFCIAYGRFSSIYELVLYAWSGLGASFGPLIIFSLYAKKINKYGAWTGVLLGAITAATWPFLNKFFTFQIPAMIIGYILGFIAIPLVSYLYRHRLGSLE